MWTWTRRRKPMMTRGLTQQGKHIGRYFCLANPGFQIAPGGLQDVPGLTASNEDHLLTLSFVADPPDSPYQVAKNEQALLDWFINVFTP
jgi:hypothetical protein